ncbi:MAG: glycosyltransferase family 2 protein [Nitriliruptoraceae bacterium]
MRRPGRGGRARVGVVVLTTGERPRELAAAVSSVRRQRDVEVELVVVVNSDDPQAADAVRDAAGPARRGPLGAAGAIADTAVLVPGSNLGIPAGRNLGVDALQDSEVVLFLDDDGELVGDEVLARAAGAFAADPTLGAVSLRNVDPDTGETQRRHVPRLRVGDPTRSSWVTTFLGGASLVRVDAFRAVGGLPSHFFYAHEETSLAWRLLDHGYRIRYAATLAMAHPAVAPARHATYHHLTGRNRVLLARQHLPAPLAVAYVLLWLVLGLVRSRGGRRALLGGFVAGLRERDVVREPIRWRTVWRMTRYGRPPLL